MGVLIKGQQESDKQKWAEKKTEMSNATKLSWFGAPVIKNRSFIGKTCYVKYFWGFYLFLREQA